MCVLGPESLLNLSKISFFNKKIAIFKLQSGYSIIYLVWVAVRSKIALFESELNKFDLQLFFKV